MPDHLEITPPSPSPSPPPPPMRNPFVLLLDLFSSVWLGIALLSLLFIYLAVGSSGVPTQINIFDPAAWVSVRQWRGLEMSEFEWFHWWPFDTLIALICVNLIITTIRRIPFNAINLGVWMIHGGILTLAAGSVWYFSTKIEGETPVVRRQIKIEVPGHKPVSIAALPGTRTVVGDGANGYGFQVLAIDPSWELLSGDDKGKKVYSVNVLVHSRGGAFIRQLLAGYPQYTEDLIMSNDPNAKQPMQRAKNVLGKPLKDEALKMSLDYLPAQHVYIAESRALYLREVDRTGTAKSPWVQRPIHNLPRYNDYLADVEDVWLSAADEKEYRPSPLRVSIPAVEAGDPLPDITFNASRFLRYATLESKRRPWSEGPLDPAVSVRLRTANGQMQQYQLLARDARNNKALGGALAFAWVESASALEQLKARREPAIRFHFPELNLTREETIEQLTGSNAAAGFKQIEGTPYSYRVESLQDGMDIGSVAIIHLRTPQRSFQRWVFDDPSKNRDNAMGEGVAQHGAQIDLDANIQTTYLPGEARPPIQIVAGPGENDLAVVITKLTGQPRYESVKPGDVLHVASDISLTIDAYAARTVAENKPAIVPRHQRQRDVEAMSLMYLDPPAGAESLPGDFWLRFHPFPFDRPEDVLRRFPYRPSRMMLEDGRVFELLFSRARMPLPENSRVALHEFRVNTHIGGFTGRASSILDWLSDIKFSEGSNQNWGDTKTVSVNKPVEHRGFWFFQAKWDAPDPARFEGDIASAGLNYTVLGVGNRNGVNVQLAGCCIAVLGMIYTFYVRPVIKRRRQQRVYEAVNA